MQIQLLEFERLRQKLDEIKPQQIRKATNFLDTALLRLDALDQSLYAFQLHSRDSISNIEKSIQALARVINNNRGGLGSHQGYAVKTLNIATQVTTERIVEHRAIEALVQQEFGRVAEEMQGGSQNRQQALGEVHRLIKDRIFAALQQYHKGSEDRQNQDLRIAQALAAEFERILKAIKEINQPETELGIMLEEVRNSVGIGIRELKEERQPKQKRLFDMISELCDRLKQQTEII